MQTCLKRQHQAKDAQARGGVAMTVISGLLGALEELSRFSETFQHLERCYESNSDSAKAAVAEIFAELSQLEQGATLASTRANVRLAVKGLGVPIALLLQNQKQASIVRDRLKEIEAQLSDSKLKFDCIGIEEFEALQETVKIGLEDLQETVASIDKRAVSIYTLLSKSVDESWNYFPVELHQTFEELANYLARTIKNDSDVATANLVNSKCLNNETETVVKKFIHSVRKAVEENKLKPKWHLYKIHGSKFQKIKSSNNGLPDSISPSYRRYGYTQEDEVWLDNDLSRLGEYGSYDFEPGELESFQPVQYIPGKGFVVFEK